MPAKNNNEHASATPPQANATAASGSAVISTDRPAAFSRRAVLTAGSATLLPLATSCSTPQPARESVLAPGLDAVLAAFADRIVPPDASGPGAVESGVVQYINHSLAEWNQADLPLLGAGLQALDTAAVAAHGESFTTLSPAQQDALLLQMEAGTLVEFTNSAQVFNRLHRLVLEGMFSDPYYGGNQGYAGWDLIGYPGAVLGSTAEMQQMGGRLPALHTSAYGEEHDGH